jgi:hypothetical protein
MVNLSPKYGSVLEHINTQARAHTHTRARARTQLVLRILSLCMYVANMPMNYWYFLLAPIPVHLRPPLTAAACCCQFHILFASIPFLSQYVLLRLQAAAFGVEMRIWNLRCFVLNRYITSWRDQGTLNRGSTILNPNASICPFNVVCLIDWSLPNFHGAYLSAVSSLGFKRHFSSVLGVVTTKTCNQKTWISTPKILCLLLVWCLVPEFRAQRLKTL